MTAVRLSQGSLQAKKRVFVDIATANSSVCANFAQEVDPLI